MAFWILLLGAIENVAVIVGATCAAIHFENPKMLWWYVLILFNSYYYNGRK